MRFKLQETYRSLCHRCKMGHDRVYKNGEHAVWCGEIGRPVRGAVEKCSDFKDRDAVGIRSMQSIAWELKTDIRGKVTGFARPKKRWVSLPQDNEF